MRELLPVLAALASGCWGLRPPDAPAARLRAAPATTPWPCALDADPAGASEGPPPVVEGAMRIEEVRGRPRLWLENRDPAEWSRDGTRIAVGGYGVVELWSAHDGRLLRTVAIPGEPFAVREISWSADGGALLVANASRELLTTRVVVALDAAAPIAAARFRDTWTGAARFATVTLARSQDVTVALAASGSTPPASFDESGALQLRTARGCYELGRGDPRAVITFAADGSSLYLGGRDEHGTPLLTQRSTADGRVLRAWRAEGAQAVGIAPAVEQAYLFVEHGVRIAGWRDGTPRRLVHAPPTSYSFAGGYDFNTPDPGRPGGQLGVVYVARDGSFLLGESRYQEQAISIWALDARERSRWIPIGRAIERIAVSSDERLFAIGATDGAVEVRARASGVKIAEIAHAAPITALAFSPDGERLAIGSNDGRVHVIASRTGASVGAARLPADRARLVTWLDASRLIVDTRYGRRITASVGGSAP